jgi:hypothetical protein
MTARLALLCALVLAAAVPAHAAGGADCAVTEIRASNEKQGVDPGLTPFKAQLSQPPLSSFDTFKLLGQKSMTLELQKPAGSPLQYGAVTLLYKDRLAVSGGRQRLKIGLDLDDHDGHRKMSTVVTLDSGTSILIAGQPYQGGTYVLALSCKTP